MNCMNKYIPSITAHIVHNFSKLKIFWFNSCKIFYIFLLFFSENSSKWKNKENSISICLIIYNRTKSNYVIQKQKTLLLAHFMYKQIFHLKTYFTMNIRI